MSNAFMTFGNSQFTPLGIPGCSLWFDASDITTLSRSGSNVTSWTSKGNFTTVVTTAGTNPTYVSNIYNGLGIVRFNFNTTAALSNASVSSAIPQTSANHTIFLTHNPNANSSTPFGFLDSTGTTAKRLSAVTTEGSNIQYDVGGRLTYSYPSQAAYLNGALRLETFYVSGGSRFYRRDGSQLATNGTISFSFDDNKILYIGGANPSYPNYNYGGDYCEIVWFNVSLTTTQIQQIEGYLAWKWGLQRNLPTTHPYYNNQVYTNSPIPLVTGFSAGVQRFQRSTLPQILTAPTTFQMNNGFFNPTRIAGCALWLDAADRSSIVTSGTTVTQVRDKSGFGNNTTASSGTSTYVNNGINGLPVISFTSTYFTGPFSAASQNTGTQVQAFAVAVMNPSILTFGRILSLGRPGVNDYGNTTTTFAFCRNGGLNLMTGRNGQYLTVNLPAYSTPFLAQSGHNGPTEFIGINGTLTPSSLNTGVNSGFNITSYGLGTDTDAAGDTLGYWYGFIGEVIYYTVFLTTAQRQQVEGYLAWKWGLQTSLPASHPYSRIPPPP